jgi:hypothetical protein
MSDHSDLDDFQAALSRWRDGCIFYFKLDLALVAAIAAVASYLKLQSMELLTVTYEYRSVVNSLVALIVYALIFELSLTSTLNRRDLIDKVKSPRWLKTASAIFHWAYAIQTFAHVAFFTFASAYLLGYSDGFTRHMRGG